MVNITEDDLKRLEPFRVGSGTFGVVYKVNDQIAYKVYRKTIRDSLTWKEVDNPAISLSPAHFNALITRSKRLKYTGGILDTLSVDGNFRGVVIPFYDGKRIEELTDLSLDRRLSLSREMVRNSKELSGHLIYTTDFKTNNIMIANGVVQFIDLDDVRTHVCHVPNLLYRAMTINSLGESIQDFMLERRHLFSPGGAFNDLEREQNFLSLTYGRIEEYLNKKSEELCVVYFNPCNIEGFIELLSNLKKKYKLVMMIEEEQLHDENLVRIVDYLKANGIGLYDIILHKNQEEYPKIENIGSAYEISSQEGLRKVYTKSKK